MTPEVPLDASPSETETRPLFKDALASFDPVDRPLHYCAGRRYEPRLVLSDWFPTNPYLWNAGKYLSRCGRKGSPAEDIRKAMTFLRWELERLEAEAATPAF